MRAGRVLRWSAYAATLVLAAGAAAGVRYDLGPAQLAEQTLRVTAAPILAVVYRGDRALVDQRTASYVRGEPQLPVASRDDPWRTVAQSVPGFDLTATVSPVFPDAEAPFVFESPDAPHLVAFRERYGLRKLVADAPSEYQAILRLGGWVGSQFDHGTDPTVGGDRACDPVGLVESGRAGARYWCEIAARVMVHAATSLGFPARIVTASRDGYTWEHAVAELWSNEFRKWVVVDTDFNEVYERGGVPLSATDLMRHGLAWQRAGELRIVPIAPEKPNIPRGGNPVALYRYVHIDLRTDWCTRPLRRGSPVGGDRATWWIADEGFRPLLTAKQRVDEQTMNWQVNGVEIVPLSTRPAPRGVAVVLGFRAYSPTFAGFEVRAPNGEWRALPGPRMEVVAAPGETLVEVRTRTLSGFPGPPTRLSLSLRRTGPPAS